MYEEIFLKGIRLTRKELEEKETAISIAIKELQTMCPHTNATKKYHSNFGNYDPSADSEWYQFDCPDCGKHWTEDK